VQNQTKRSLSQAKTSTIFTLSRQNMTENQEEKDKKTTFKDLGLNEEILRALEDIGFENPTPVQEKSIPLVSNSNDDVLALAQTGTGKTAAFSLPLIQKITRNSKNIETLILCPTRELCLQIAKDIKQFTKYTSGIETVAVYGGDRIDRQIRELNKKPQIIVGTPGRTNDLINRKKLKLESIKYLVLDEADEMLTMGFKEELDTILENTPEEKQVLLFSATMPRSIDNIAKRYMKNPKEISVAKKNTGAENVKHIFYMAHARDRYETLRRIADLNPAIYGIIFCRTRRETQEVAEKLIQDHYSAEAIHGDLSQTQREHVMNRFRKKQTQILVATDVAARGIDVKDLTHVINYNLPDQLEAYVHRSGRTGRAGMSGTSISIVHMRESYRISRLESKVGKKFTQEKIPSGHQICEAQLLNLIDKIDKIKVNNKQIEKYIGSIYEKLEHLSREDLIKHFVSAEFNRFLSAYENAPDLNMKVSSRNERGNSRGRGADIQFTNVTIDLGKVNEFNKQVLFKLINSQRNLKGVEIGDIEIYNNESKFEIDSAYEKEIIKCFNNTQFEGRHINVNTEKGKVKASKRSSGRSRGNGGRSRNNYSRSGHSNRGNTRNSENRSGGYSRSNRNSENRSDGYNRKNSNSRSKNNRGDRDRNRF